MRAVGIKALKDHLSEYVRIAATGETVLVTDRDRVVAELHPPAANRAPDVGDALLAELMRTGAVRPPVISTDRLPVRPSGQTTLRSLLDELDQDREDRFPG